MKSYSTHIIINDIHIPYHDEKSLESVVKFLTDFKPDALHINGDMLDCYQLSRFDKDPKRVLELQDDLDKATEWISKFRKAIPKGEIYYHLGNHEERIKRYKWGSPELSSLKALTLEEMLHFKENNVQKLDYDKPYVHQGRFLIYHGSIVRKNAGYTAKAELEKWGISGISGHTHRAAKYSKDDMSGHKEWIENGHLCDSSKCDYILGVPDWSQAISVVYLPKDKKDPIIVDQIPIYNHKINYQGKQYGG